NAALKAPIFAGLPGLPWDTYIRQPAQRNRPMALKLAVVVLALYVGPAALDATPTSQDSAAGPDSSAILGRLVARDSHEPIRRARVGLDTKLTTTTDSSGHFTFTGLAPGTHT